MRLLITAFVLTLSTISFVQAQATSSTEDIAVYAEVCEKVNPEESKASARVRAMDKASFKAVEDIPDLDRYRSGLDTHNFNLKVYNLIDNYLEDIKTAVTQQTDAFVCVEVNAFLPEEAVVQVFEQEKLIQDTAEQQVVSLDVEDPLEDGSISVPPRPEIIINKEIAYDSEVQIPVISGEDGVLVPVAEVEDLRTKIFVDKTEFYNGTDTNGFFPALAQVLKTKQGIKVLSEKNNPDYILKTKILKAKVDNVNSETGRLQIVASADLIDTKTSEVKTEHLNKFELFNLSDDAQKKASILSKQLFEELVQKFLPDIKTNSDEKQFFPSVITPN